jgi:hypothetical protein
MHYKAFFFLILVRFGLRPSLSLSPPVLTLWPLPAFLPQSPSSDSLAILEHPDSGTGFKLYKYKPEAFFGAIKSALELFQDGRKWVEVRKRAMSQLY